MAKTWYPKASQSISGRDGNTYINEDTKQVLGYVYSMTSPVLGWKAQTVGDELLGVYLTLEAAKKAVEERFNGA